MISANQQIGQAIRQVRVRRGLTQTQLGELIGKPRNTICTYEKGKITLPVTVLLEISEVLGVSINRLLPTDTKKTQPKNKM